MFVFMTMLSLFALPSSRAATQISYKCESMAKNDSNTPDRNDFGTLFLSVRVEGGDYEHASIGVSFKDYAEEYIKNPIASSVLGKNTVEEYKVTFEMDRNFYSDTEVGKFKWYFRISKRFFIESFIGPNQNFRDYNRLIHYRWEGEPSGRGNNSGDGWHPWSCKSI